MAQDLDSRLELLSMDEAELERFVTVTLGERRFRAAQLQQWLNLGVDFSEMTNLPATLRQRLTQLAVANPVRLREYFVSKLDGTVKFLWELRDGNLIEGVLMRYHYGYTLCVSTQVGCRMGCAFCASTLQGRARDLSAAEILGQVIAANRFLRDRAPSANGPGELDTTTASGAESERRVHNIVLMGSGEPFDNYYNVIRFLRLVNAPAGLNISLRNISLSTCGLTDRIWQFADEGLPVTLSLSLHAPNDVIRQQLMPVARAYPMDGLLAAVRHYVETTGRRAIFEYALVKGVNSGLTHADELARRLRGLQAHVNLIPMNDVPERALHAPSAREIQAFLQRLRQRGISATMRRQLGADINGACGQLRRRYMQTRGEGQQ